jgi:branched-chain amino acid aminotransferase
MVREGTVYTPPATEGSLESITLDLIEALATSMGIPFQRRPIDRTELLIADEVGVCGTLAELTIAQSIEGLQFSGESPILSALQRRYLDAVRGVDPHPAVEMSMLPASALLPAEALRSSSI